MLGPMIKKLYSSFQVLSLTMIRSTSDNNHKTDIKEKNSVKEGNILQMLAMLLEDHMKRNSCNQERLKQDDDKKQQIEKKKVDRFDAEERRHDRIILFTNKQRLFRAQHGLQFEAGLDARDKVLSHVFSFQMMLNDSNKAIKFHESADFKRLLEQITSYLVDVVENVLSITFKNLTEGRLTEKEAKDYAAKNILLNVHSLQTCIMDTLIQDKLVNEDDKKNVFFQFAQHINNALKESIGIRSVYYPQAPPTGATPRMREHIIPLNRSNNQEFDFLFTQGIKLDRESDEDYTGFIMKVINRAIESTGEIDESSNSLYQTMFEKFIHFSENLFWLAQQDSYHDILKSIDEEKNKQKGALQKRKTEKIQWLKKIMPQERLRTAKSNGKIKSVAEPEVKLKAEESQDIKISSKAQLLSEYFSLDLYSDKSKDKGKTRVSDHASQRGKELFSEKWKDKSKFKQSHILKMKEHHAFLIGKKITNAQTFTQKDIKDHHLSIKNSSILRLLTKWATSLEDIFKNPEQFTRDRLYPFKSFDQSSILLKQKQKIEICKNIKENRKEMEVINKELITKYRSFEGMFLCQNQNNLSQYVKRFTEARVISSKMNALLTKFMCQYLSSLINLLVRAGKVKKEPERSEGESGERYIYVNLVIFPIGDLMRSKFHCNEASFIRLLKTLYFLDEADRREKPFFQLVNIKNKLDTKDNNILINYLFMGKLQVELQMSVQQIKGKQEHYCNFNHFLYELKRGKFGILAECATVVSQYDPIVSSSTDDYYQPKLKNTSIPKGFNEQLFNKDERDKSFVCNVCQKLIISENMFFLKRQGQKNICNKCVLSKHQYHTEVKTQKNQEINTAGKHAIDKYHSECALLKQLQRQLIQKNIAEGKMKKFVNFHELFSILTNSSHFLIATLNSKLNVFEVAMVGKLEQADKWFLSAIDCCKFDEFDIQKMPIEYEDISKDIKNNKKAPQFSYIIDIKQKSAVLSQLLNRQIIITDEKLRLFGEQIKEKIIKDNILNSLQGKSQTISFNEDPQKFRAIEQIMTCKSHQTNLSSIEYLSACGINRELIPQWMKNCQKLKSLNFNCNNISSIKNLRISSNFRNIQEIMMDSNRLTEMKITKGNRLANLQSVYIRQNKIRELTLCDLPRLKYLNASYNEGLISNIKLKNLKSLETLVLVDIKSEDLKRLNKFEVEDFQSLKTLNLYNNSLTSMKIKNCNNLRVLLLSSNALPSLRAIFGHEGKEAKNIKDLKLKKLNLSHNNNIQIELHNLPQTLKDLNLQSTKLKQIQFSELPKNIERVNVSYNEDIVIDFDLKEMSCIKELDVSCCFLSSINLEKYQKMQKLNLAGNQIRQLELGHMPFLKQLDISDNLLGQQTIDFPKSLQILKFRNNNIKWLKKFVFPATLKEFDLSKNRIFDLQTSALPSELSNLNLNQNCLEKYQCQNLMNLEEVHLDSSAENKNSVKIKEMWISDCPKIEKISAKYNSIQILILKQLPCIKQINLGKINLKNIQLVNIGQEPRFLCSEQGFKKIQQVYPKAAKLQ